MMQKNNQCLIQCLILNQRAPLIFKITFKVVNLISFKGKNIKPKQQKKVKAN